MNMMEMFFKVLFIYLMAVNYPPNYNGNQEPSVFANIVTAQLNLNMSWSLT